MSKALQQYASEVTNGVACDSEGRGEMMFAKRRELHEITAIILSHRQIGTWFAWFTGAAISQVGAVLVHARGPSFSVLVFHVD